MAAVGSDLLDGDERYSKEPVCYEESLQDETQPYKVFGYFRLLYPIYRTIKFSSEYSSKFFGIMEKIFFALLSHLPGRDTSREFDQEEDVTLYSELISLFRIWFQSDKILRQSALYIEKLYEDVVPLVPGQLPPFFNLNVDTMPVRTMCSYATIHMIGRLSHHTVSYITNIFRRIRSFILNPSEDTAMDLKY